MQLIKPRLPLLLLLACCGPEAPAQVDSNWMLGTWSNEAVGFESNSCAIEHIIFEKDGRAFRRSPRCGAGATYNEPTELTWEHDGESAVILHFPEEDYYDGWRLSVGERPPTGPECNAFSIETILNGVRYEDIKYAFKRGSVCTEEISACDEGAGNCESYRTVWCDEPPEDCEDVLPCSCK